MADLPTPVTVAVPRGYFFHGQLQHLILLAALLPGVWGLAQPILDGTTWWGVQDHTWLAIAVAIPIIHQVLVVLAWRAQLSHQWMTRLLGRATLGVWGALFFPLLVARPLSLIALGAADPGSLPLPPAVAVPMGLLLFVPTLWTMHSVRVHFGFARALGGDHFFEKYRVMPFVRKGAFAYSSNAMYTFAFLGLWGIALVRGSQAALAVALFQHAYIWVHWYCTEKPDADLLHGSK